MIIIASTVEYYLSTMQKYPTLAFSGSHQQMMLRRHPWTCHFMIFWCFGAFFWHTWWRHQYVLRAKVLKLFVLKTFVSSAENLTSIGRQMHSKQPLIPVRGQNILCWKLVNFILLLLLLLLLWTHYQFISKNINVSVNFCFSYM